MVAHLAAPMQQQPAPAVAFRCGRRTIRRGISLVNEDSSPTRSRSPIVWIAGFAVVLLIAGIAGYSLARRAAVPDSVPNPGETPASAAPGGAPVLQGDNGTPAGAVTPAAGRIAAGSRPTPDLAVTPPAFTGEPATERVEFRPAMPAGEPRPGGYCERESLMAPRADAFHCAVDNQAHDPCFLVAGDDRLVICNARPGNESAAFLLRLVEPPQANRASEPPEEPWMLELGDTVCERRLALQLVTFGGKPIRYDCRDGTLIIDLVREGEAWAAQRVTIRIENSPVADVAEWVPVRRAWW